MKQLTSFLVILFVHSFQTVFCVTCDFGHYTYYCSPGQTCGYYFGDCRGLSVYAITGIVCGGIILLSVCIRCCIHYNSTSQGQRTRNVNRTRRVNRIEVQSTFGNTRPIARIHMEEPPPTYQEAIRTVPQDQKY